MELCKSLDSATSIAEAHARQRSQVVERIGDTLIAAVATCRRDDRIGNALSPSGWTEEVGAVVEGRFELIFDDETHLLDAGQAAAIDNGQPHEWKCLSERGVLYRVALKAIAADEAS